MTACGRCGGPIRASTEFRVRVDGGGLPTLPLLDRGVCRRCVDELFDAFVAEDDRAGRGGR